MPAEVSDGTATLTVPVAGMAVSHVPPAGTVATVALQLKALAQAPAASMVIGCGGGAGWPMTPWKTRAGNGVEREQGACTINVTGRVCGLPAAARP